MCIYGALMIMLKRIKVYPLAFESFGVRSMCTYVETSDIKILLDAGLALGPNRFGFPPHPKEYAALKERRDLILKTAEKADIITVSHYHFDHHTPSFTDWANLWTSAEIAAKIYRDKTVFAKSFKSKINFSQRRRGWLFKKKSGRLAARLEYADGRSFRFGRTAIRFTSPVFHGRENSDLGWVLITIIEYGDEKILFAPDVQGPICNDTLKIILGESANLAIIGGPPLYLADFRISPETIDRAVKNLMLISQHVPTVILDHHLLRESRWKEKLQPIFDLSSSMGHRIVTAAEYIGESNNLLEATRNILFETEPPSQEFMRWAKMPMKKRKLIPPPI